MQLGAASKSSLWQSYLLLGRIIKAETTVAGKSLISTSWMFIGNLLPSTSSLKGAYCSCGHIDAQLAELAMVRL